MATTLYNYADALHLKVEVLYKVEGGKWLLQYGNIPTDGGMFVYDPSADGGYFEGEQMGIALKYLSERRIRPEQTVIDSVDTEGKSVETVIRDLLDAMK